jgi:hypothetical protein
VACLPLKFQPSYVLNNVRRGRWWLRIEIRHLVLLRMCVRSWPAQSVSKRIPVLLPDNFVDMKRSGIADCQRNSFVVV